jgi:hypothetical protein
MSARKGQQSRAPGPSIRPRFVRRAKTLKRDKRFHQDLARARETWNRDHPKFAAHEEGQAPQDLDLQPLNIVWPPRIVRLRDNAKAINQEVDAEVRIAGGHWIDLALQLCQKWWPPEHHFPNWLGLMQHPAQFFVSACMLYQPGSVPEEWIVSGNLGPHPLPFDPRDEASHPGTVFWMTYASVLTHLIDRAIADGDIIDDAWRDRAARAATQAATLERLQVLDRDPPTMWWYLAFFPGITVSDRDEFMESVRTMTEQIYGDDPLRPLVQRMVADGMTQEDIGGELGISRRAVGRLLEGL